MKFNFDNPFFEGISKVIDGVYLSILWMVCSLPIFTIGASSVALYYTVHKSYHNDQDYITRSFFKAFKENFKQATIIWLIQFLVICILAADTGLFYYANAAGSSIGWMVYFFVVCLILILLWTIFTIAYQARFENTIINTLKNSALIAFASLPQMIMIFLTVLIAGLFVYLTPVLLLLVPAVTVLIFDLILEKVFTKFIRSE